MAQHVIMHTPALPHSLQVEVVRDIGHGDLAAGHQVLSKFVVMVRNQAT
jgi:hypothetical protein